MPIRRWVTAQGDKQLSRAIATRHGISPFAAHLLVTRGFTQDDAIRQMLDPAGCPLGSPDEFTDMAKATERIRRAIDNYELITIYGDYDVDGITATALLYSCLEGMGARVQYMLPSRDDGGYGLHLPAIDRMAETGTKLIITVDNGITAIDEIKYAYSKDIEVIITDHHKPLDTLPEAEAILNAHVAGNRCSCTDLAGVGVAFKLACALEGDQAEAVKKYADLVALGTVADAVALVGENRTLVALGLEQLRSAHRTGIRQLIIASGADASRLTATDIAFSLAPRINSAGRLGKPDRVVQL
ncbi:MAG: single-stranded-DNA-specific exonuclease RecJ, partial [Ruminococcaceae bacterium]|nr:single-stranded-DNA-specific exonuclease RecJ [Oscillospiraceae bacterium]